jgi:hypothetical protein
MKDNPGYSTGRTAARDPAVIGNGNGPKERATSFKPQAASFKPKAASFKL